MIYCMGSKYNNINFTDFVVVDIFWRLWGLNYEIMIIVMIRILIIYNWMIWLDLMSRVILESYYNNIRKILE